MPVPQVVIQELVARPVVVEIVRRYVQSKRTGVEQGWLVEQPSPRDDADRVTQVTSEHRQVVIGRWSDHGLDRQMQAETITLINQRTATVDCEGGAGWRVPFAMLCHLMDI